MTTESATTMATDAVGHHPGHPLLELSGLHTQFATRDGMVQAVHGVDLTVPAGKTVCIVGESGCGKSVTARSVLGLVDHPGHVNAGHVWWNSPTLGHVDLAAMDPKGADIRHVRAQEIGMVFQEPIASLSPMYTVGAQLGEMLRLHQGMSKQQARERAVELLTRVGIPKPHTRVDAYPWQMSGGMCQRVMIAMALAGDPTLLIADEPTTALDVTIQARILDLFRELQDETGMSVLFITHDLGVVAEIADEVAVMYLGRVVEQGTVEEIFENPRHPYTRALMGSIPTLGHTRRSAGRLTTIRGTVPHGAHRPTGCSFHPRCDVAVAGLCEVAAPRTLDDGARLIECHRWDPEALGSEVELGLPTLRQEATPTTAERANAENVTSAAGKDLTESAPLLEVREVSMRFPVRSGFLNRHRADVHALDGVSLSIRPGETLGLVGESGCGKTTLGRCIVRAEDPTEGQILYRNSDGVVDLAGLHGGDLRSHQREVRMIFQDPFSSLNPRMTLGQIIGEPLVTHRVATGSELQDRVAQMLRRVGLSPDYMDRYPHAFSGGQRQRVNIARALILEPKLVVADEAVSALDVSVRAQILNLLQDLQDELDLTYLFISHDLSVVQSVCDRVAVMYLGKVVEVADTRQVFDDPQHPYTEALLSAVPIADPARRGEGRRIRLSDDLPDPIDRPAGCFFHTRCRHAVAGLCDGAAPALVPTADVVDGQDDFGRHRTACLRHSELELTGIAGTQEADR
ncbi:ABC transporter ATP-binding protein [Ruania halotolerans]|uniref:ABC transporter ATP-binding protein n=1 Tax=Ruania halotolerans TaxID=2897773 RepID=UPI001E449A2A|nr:ABC transporter ATP-binding protein [Ruania halotolerans]UFU07380.1 ABC transporter ATP-binding protein [Ruania halotolerans]